MRKLSYEIFEKTILGLKEEEERQNKLDSSLEDYTSCRIVTDNKCSSLIIDVLTDVMDIEDKDLLSWWLYECEMGQRKSMSKIYLPNNEIITLYNLKELYDYIYN